MANHFCIQVGMGADRSWVMEPNTYVLLVIEYTESLRSSLATDLSLESFWRWQMYPLLLLRFSIHAADEDFPILQL